MGIDSSSRKPVAASVAAELAYQLNLQDVQDVAGEYVQFAEDDEYYYVDIGKSEAISRLWAESFERMQALEDKFNRTLLAILHELQAEEMSTSQKNGGTAVIAAVTPSKSKSGPRGQNKRPAPGSSSVNKVILYQTKRPAPSSATKGRAGQSSLANTSYSSTAKTNQTRRVLDWNSKDTVDKLGPKKQPFIAVEQSIRGQNVSNIVDASNTSTVIRTRSQARLLASTATKATSTQYSTGGRGAVTTPMTSSASKATRARKVPTKVPKNEPAYGTPSRGAGRGQVGTNFISKEDSTSSSKRVINGEVTPSKISRNVIDLSAISVTGPDGGLGRSVRAPGMFGVGFSSASKATKAAYNTTPAKRGGVSSSAPGTPFSSSTSVCSSNSHNRQRAECERARQQEKLLLSEDKRKKADEKKRDMLESRAQRLKAERDARMEKIRENKMAIEARQQAKKVAETGGMSMVKSVTNTASARNNVRRRALESAALVDSPAAAPSKPKTRAANLRTRAANRAIDNSVVPLKKDESSVVKETTSTKGRKKAVAGKSAKGAPTSTTSGGKRKLFDDDRVDGGEVKMKADHQNYPQKPDQLSPIAKVVSDNQPGINTRLNETFTTEAVLQTEVPIGTSFSKGFFVAPAAPGLVSIKSTTTTTSTELNYFYGPSGGASKVLPTSTAAHSTFIAEIANDRNGPSDNVTFAMPAIPEIRLTPKLTPKQVKNEPENAGTFNMAKKILHTPKGTGAGNSQYEMTPPPAPEGDNNYDISRYIDSDEEEEENKEQQATSSGKRVPPWALGRPFLNQLHRQFRQTDEELAAQAGRLFRRPLLPVPLEDMGLPVRNRYAVRSSSVNWKTAESISKALK